MSSETLIYEKEDFEEGSMVTLTMNKPETLNALNIEFSREIDEALTYQRCRQSVFSRI
jgi:enoyl-CoA hydratase/carnithine racemase